MNDFENYMTQNLAKAGESMSREGDELARLPYLQCWIRTKSYVVFFLSNGTFQCNFLVVSFNYLTMVKFKNFLGSFKNYSLSVDESCNND